MRPRAVPERHPSPLTHSQAGFSMALANPSTRGQWSWQRTSWISMVSDRRLGTALGTQPPTTFPTPITASVTSPLGNSAPDKGQGRCPGLTPRTGHTNRQVR